MPVKRPISATAAERPAVQRLSRKPAPRKTDRSGESRDAGETLDAGEALPASRRRGSGDAVVNSVASAVKILAHLSVLREPVGVTKLARDLKLNTSTCFNILKTLARTNLVEIDSVTKGYSIGMGIVDLARNAFSRDTDLSLVQPLMSRVAREHGITVSLLRRISDNRMMIVQVAVSDAPIRIALSVGQRLPLLLGSAGRIMAAFSDLDEADLRRKFELLRWDRPITFATFLEQVAEARRKSWAVDDGFYARGTITVSVPVLDRAGRPVFACSGTMFTGQYNEESARRVADALTEIRAALESRLQE